MANDWTPDSLVMKPYACVYAFTSCVPMLDSLVGVMPMATFSLDEENPVYLNIVYVPDGVCMAQVEDAYVNYRIFAHQMLGVYHGRISANG